jgi:Leucine-rich repeat (LRR) protein
MKKLKPLTILKEDTYKGCPILIQKLDSYFQYLLLFNNKFYQQYWKIAPHGLRRFLKNKYSQKQLVNITRMMLTSAQAIITILEKKHVKTKKSKASK